MIRRLLGHPILVVVVFLVCMWLLYLLLQPRTDFPVRGDTFIARFIDADGSFVFLGWGHAVHWWPAGARNSIQFDIPRVLSMNTNRHGDVVMGCIDGWVYFWNNRMDAPERAFQMDACVSAVAISSDSRFIIAAEGNKLPKIKPGEGYSSIYYEWEARRTFGVAMWDRDKGNMKQQITINFEASSCEFGLNDEVVAIRRSAILERRRSNDLRSGYGEIQQYSEFGVSPREPYDPRVRMHYVDNSAYLSLRHVMMANFRLFFEVTGNDWKSGDVKWQVNVHRDGPQGGVSVSSVLLYRSEVGLRLFVGYADGIVKCFDVDSGECLWTVKARQIKMRVYALDVSWDGKRLITGGQCKEPIWNTPIVRPVPKDYNIRIFDLPKECQ